MNEPAAAAPDAQPCVEPKPCRKCEAYREINQAQAQEIARLRKSMENIKGWRLTLSRYIGEGLQEEWA